MFHFLLEWVFSELFGGSTMLPGFADMMEKEITVLNRQEKKCALTDLTKRVIATPERRWSVWSVWIGGSMVASLGRFSQICVSKTAASPPNALCSLWQCECVLLPLQSPGLEDSSEISLEFYGALEFHFLRHPYSRIGTIPTFWDSLRCTHSFPCYHLSHCIPLSRIILYRIRPDTSIE